MTCILVVDDDPAIRELLVQVFSDEGYATATARNGKEARTYLEVTAALPCLILLDMMMPVMNGAQFWRVLKANTAWTVIPVIILSAGIYLQHAGGALPIVAMMSKPIDIARLLILAGPYCFRARAVRG
jgi:two-component system, chemotaxis family, chemotaxis protein CheY